MATWSTVQMKDKGSHCITRTCSIAIHRWLIDSHSSIPTTCNDSFISATTISPGKSLLPTPYRASSRAGKKRLLTATHGRRAKKAFARQKSQTSPHPGVAESLYLQPQHRLAGRPPFPISRQTSHRSAALSRAAQHAFSSGTASGPRLTI